MGAKLLAPAEGWWPSATNWGPFGPPNGGPLGSQMGALQAPWTNTNTYIVQIQIHIGCKYKFNNQGQICYVIVVVQNELRLG